jgi:hypothetical protein
MFGWFFDRTATFELVDYPLDPAGGTVPAALPLSVALPACIQQDVPPERLGDGTYRSGTRVKITVFFLPSGADDPALALAALGQLDLESRLQLDDGRIILLEGKPFDRSGRGLVWEAVCRYTT